jgi:hypothetical protein
MVTCNGRLPLYRYGYDGFGLETDIRVATTRGGGGRMPRLALESIELRRRIPQENGEIAGRRLRGHLVEHIREAAVAVGSRVGKMRRNLSVRHRHLLSSKPHRPHVDGGCAPYCGEQSPTPTPCPSGIHPSVTICANSLASVTSRWFGAPPMPLLYKR